MRLIDADKLKQHFAWWHEGGEEADRQAEIFEQIIDVQPTAQSEPITANIDHELTQEEYEKLRKDMANAPIVLLPSVQPEIIRCKDMPTGKWIPCSESLPEEDNETGNGVQYSNAVLITVFNKEDEETIIDFAHTANGTWYSYVSDCSIPHGWKVLAWMPLPEPYREEGEE